MGVTIANAYVQIDPSFKGIEAKLHAGLDAPLEKAGRQAGEKAGKQVGAGIEKASREAGKKAGASISSGIGDRLDALDRNRTKLMVGLAGIGIGLKKSIDAASDLNETLSKSQVIFGDAASGFEDIANGAAKSMGLSKRAYLDAAAGLKGLLDNLGLASAESIRWSKSMTQLGSDLGSFFNTDPADAIEAIGSALRGESEPIRRYNVNINEAAVKAKALALGLYDGKGAIEQSAKATATLALITEQTARAQGDFARTADGVANSQRTAAAEAENAAASFGQALLPVYQRVVQVVTAVAQGFARLPAGVQVGVVALGGLVALSGPIGGMVSTIGKLGGALKGLGGDAGGLSMLSKIGVGVGLATTAVGVGLAIWQKMGEKQREIAARSKEVAAALPAQVSETWKLADASGAAAGKVDGLTIANIALSKSLASNGEDGAKLTQALGTLGFQTEDTLDVLRRIKTDGSAGIASIGRQAGLTAQEASLMAKALADTDGNIDDVATSFAYFATKVGGGVKGMKLSRDAAEAMWTKIKPLVEAMGELEGQAKKTNLDDVARQYLTTAAASSEAADAAIRQAEADTHASRAGQGALDVYIRYQEILAGKTAAERAAILGTENLTEATGGLKTVAGATLRTIERTASALDRAADAASGFASAIDKVSGPAVDLEESSRRIRENAVNLAKAFKENGTSLDINTEKGRANREAIQASVEGLREHATAMLKSGASAEEAAAFLNFSTNALVDQAVEAKVSEEEMRGYLETLGATPEQVDTAIRLLHDQEAKSRVDDLIAKLGDIPESEWTEIKALIENGSYAEAERRLLALTRKRTAVVEVGLRGAGAQLALQGKAGKLDVKWTALGDVVDRPSIRGVGEAGAEAILPLTNPARMRELVRDPRVLGPVTRALPGGGGLVVNFNGPVSSPADVARAVESAWRRLTAQRRFAS